MLFTHTSKEHIEMFNSVYITGNHYNKPSVGLWCMPSPYTWKEYANKNDRIVYSINIDMSNILMLNTFEDMLKIARIFPLETELGIEVDWNAVLNSGMYTGVYISDTCIHERDNYFSVFEFSLATNTWEIESLCLWDMDAILSVEEIN